MLNRRSFIKVMSAGIGLPMVGCGGGGSSSSTNNSTNTGNGGGSGTDSGDTGATDAVWTMPDESAPHHCTWMAFGASRAIWGSDLLPVVQQNLGDIARTLAEYESVRMLVRSADLARAQAVCGDAVEMIITELDDLWIRDTGPVFVQNEVGQRAGVDFNFNGWGNKQAHAKDALVAQFVTQQANVTRLTTSLVLEGGSIEVDGEGTAIITESSVLNANRNPGVSKAQAEAELKRLLGLEKIIWLPGIAGRDITDGHVDFYARFSKPGAVVAALEPDPAQYDYQVTRTHLDILQNATDARGRRLDVVTLEGPQTVREAYDTEDFAAGYLNYYVANNVVLMPQFGDSQADARALLTLQELYPTRTVRQVNIDGIAAGGGGIHCATQQEPQA